MTSTNENEQPSNNEGDLDYYVQLKKRMFGLLDTIVQTQMSAASNAKNGKNVNDFQKYNIKVNLQLKALSNAKDTINTILNQLDKQENIDSRLAKIEAFLKEMGLNDNTKQIGKEN